MSASCSRCILILAGLAILLSTTIQTINLIWHHYPGNNYFPDNVGWLFFLLLLIWMGLKLSFSQESTIPARGRELIYFFAIMSLIAFTTNAVQLTPFPTIDTQIITFEQRLHIDMAKIIAWTHTHPLIKRLLEFSYASIDYQLSLIPVVVILSGHISWLREFYYFLIVTVLIGFSFYYIFPTTAPASNILSPLFGADQLATGLKFTQIHQHIIPTTNEGGLIAMPSFHAIWAILCVYLIREWRLAASLLALNNLLLLLSCVLLGWHYPSDLIGSILVLIPAFAWNRWCQRG
ncbi:MAG: hypothetical protein BGO90_05860 [Legionella sp. 40-6]|nr:phosphatase PAP2 family protein [Legionella sp.]OJY32972.1 MAG: hypothetical protein BGO90_05860 [Legionella sp. 40-6]